MVNSGPLVEVPVLCNGSVNAGPDHKNISSTQSHGRRSELDVQGDALPRARLNGNEGPLTENSLPASVSRSESLHENVIGQNNRKSGGWSQWT